jgi:hypothetical protein
MINPHANGKNRKITDIVSCLTVRLTAVLTCKAIFA